MSSSQPSEDAKKSSKSPEKVLEDAIKKSPANDEGRKNEPKSGDKDQDQATSGATNAVPATNPAAHGYDEVKSPRPANVDGNFYSTPSSLSRYGASDYLVPRSSNYEPVFAPQPEGNDMRVSTSYEVPRPTSPTVHPPTSGYMPLQTRPKTPDHYSSKDNLPSTPKVTRSASKELITGASRNDSKVSINPPRKGSRELVKTPSISKGLDVVIEQSQSTMCTWNTVFSIMALILALLALVFSIASLGVSGSQRSTTNNNMTSNANLTARVDSIQSQLSAGLAKRPNCSSFVYDDCSFNSSSSVSNECVTGLLAEDSPVSGITCAIDVSHGMEVPLELFSARLFRSSDGYGCRCSHSNSTTLSNTDNVFCVLIVSMCL